MISLKAQAIGEAKQEHTKQFLVYCNNFGVTIQGWVSFDNLIMATPIMSIQVGNLALQPMKIEWTMNANNVANKTYCTKHPCSLCSWSSWDGKVD